MSITADDISIVLSGGINNLDPSLSLGGYPSTKQIRDGLVNNLFADVTPDQTSTGYEDYRCFYVFNDSEDPVYNIEVWIESEVEGGASIELGIEEADETQRITLVGLMPTSGHMILSYEGIPFTINTFTDLGEAATEIQTALNSLVDENGLPLLENVTVLSPSSLGSSVFLFDIIFSGHDGKRSHDQITVVENTYEPSVVISVAVTQQGAPVNTIAPEVLNEVAPPPNVNFYVPTSESPINLYILKPTDGFPIWVKRTTPKGATSVASDGANLRFRMETINP